MINPEIKSEKRDQLVAFFYGAGFGFTACTALILFNKS